MSKHSASGGINPFKRKHDRLSHQAGKGRPVRAVSEVGGASRRKSQRLNDPSSRRRGALEEAPAHLKAERARKKAMYRRVMLGVSVGVLVALVATVGAAYVYVKRLDAQMRSPIMNSDKLAELTKGKPQEPYTILMLGGDGKPGAPQRRTDTMILARVDPKGKRVWLLSIPRDTRVNIPGRGYDKINAAYFYGGPSLAIKTVSQFTGVPINHYMEVDFRGFKKAVDAMGGIWIDVPVEIDDRRAASFAKDRDAVKHIDPGYQLLDGDHALVFVRSRDFIDADFSRMRHQQIFFKALADQIASRENIKDLPRVVSSVAPHIGTDMTLLDMVKSAIALKGAGSSKVYTATVPGEWRNPYVWPDEENKTALIDRMMGDRSFDDTTTPEAADPTSDSKEPRDIDVVVRNGGGVPGCAKQASSILTVRAFNVVEVGNANQFVYEDTLVVYTTDKAAAAKVAATLPPGARLVESRGMYSFTGDVLVVIGKDWDLSKVPVTPVHTD